MKSKKFFHQGALLKGARTRLSLSQIELAGKLGFSSQFLGRIEKGTVSMPWPSLKKACKILGLDEFKLSNAIRTDFRNDLARFLSH